MNANQTDSSVGTDVHLETSLVSRIRKIDEVEDLRAARLAVARLFFETTEARLVLLLEWKETHQATVEEAFGEGAAELRGVRIAVSGADEVSIAKALAKSFFGKLPKRYPLGTDEEGVAYCLLVDITKEREPWCDLLMEIAVAQLEVTAQRLHARSKSALDLEALKSEFLSGISHELRSPLTVIMGAADTLASTKGMSEEDRVEFITLIQKESERMKVRVDDLLTMAELQAGRRRISCQSLDLNELLRDSLPIDVDREIDLQVASDVSKVWADRQALRHAVGALIDNAVKFTESGGHIRVSCRNQDNGVCVEIEDDGAGVDEVAQEALFARFYRTETHAHVKPGLGLGLSIGNSLVEAHGGHIEWEHRREGGALFRIWLPIESESLDVAAQVLG